MSKVLDVLELIGYLKDYHSHAVPYCNWLYEIEEYISEVEEYEKAFEILKKYVYYSNKSHCIRMREIRKSTQNFDYEDLKEVFGNEK